MAANFQNNRRNPYLIKNDGRTVVFRTPLWRTLLALFLSVPCFAIGLAPLAMTIGWVERWGLRWDDLVFPLFGTPGLLLGFWSALSSGTTKITFDLQRRTYRQIALAPPPLFGKRYPDTTGWGNPFLRRVVQGHVDDDLEGVQIVEREEKSQRIYSIYVVPKDRSVSPCVVYYCTSLLDAQAQLQEISALVGLPTLKTMLMDNAISSNRVGNALLPGDVAIRRQWASIHYGVYWAQCSETEINFALPSTRRRARFVCTGFFLFLALLCVSIGIYCTIIHDPTVNFGNWCFLAVCWLAIAAASFTFTGNNRITFDLRHRTYERVLYRSLVIGSVTDYAGMGNRFRRSEHSGTTKEIAGIALHGRPGKHSMTYAVLLRWADNRQPPMGIGFFADRREALEQAREVSEVLSLPILGIDDK